MIIDVNVNLSRWPFRRLPCDETPRLVAGLRRHQVAQAWAGSFDALLHHDLAGVNERLDAECRQHGKGLLLPVGAVNPMLPDWQEDLRRCHEVHGMHAIRLHPNYHGYGLDHEACKALFAAAQARRLIVQIALVMEDERTQHPLINVPAVDPGPLEALIAGQPDLPVVILNNRNAIRGSTATRLVAAGNVYFDISHAEQVGTLERLIQETPYQRLLFGSHFPYLNLEAALLKFRESQLDEATATAITHGNAKRLLTFTGHLSAVLGAEAKKLPTSRPWHTTVESHP